MNAPAGQGRPLAELAEEARAARSAGDLARARQLLDAALAQTPDDVPTWLKLLEVDILRDEGRADEARGVLEALRLSDPENFWPAFHLATLARDAGDLAAARMHLDAGLAMPNADSNVWMQLLQADLLRDEGRDEAARTVLTAAVKKFPEMIWLHHRLGRLAEDHKAFRTARGHFEDALHIDPTQMPMQLAVVRLLQVEGQAEAARQRLEGLRAAAGTDARVLLPLAHAYRQVGKFDREQACLADAIAVDPLASGVLRHLITTRAQSVPPDELDAVTEGLKGRVEEALLNELRISARVQRMQYEEALTAIRRDARTRDRVTEARQLALVLFGAHRYALGLRYVRRCLRRWPGSPELWQVYVTEALKQGLIDEVTERIKAISGQLPDHVLLDFRLSICGYRNDLEGAVECFALLRALGLDTPVHRGLMGKLIYTKQDVATAGALFERIGSPGAEDARLLHRGGLVGMMTLEFDLEREALAAGGYADTRDWLAARPGSTVAAIRLIDEWGAGEAKGQSLNGGEGVIPRRIYQYWDSADLPEVLEPLVASWQSLPGCEHRLLDRTAALQALREEFGTDWVRAFQLAQDAAQEADLLRLCLLAKFGGIWADTDDYLHGDLDHVLGAGRGLILYREPLGGALANNFIAAVPQHPVVVFAANMAREALLQRANEIAWNKTGPGLLTRALAHYLAQTDPTAAEPVTVLDWVEISRVLAPHIPVSYKSSARYWATAGNRREEDLAWEALKRAVLGSPEAEARPDA